MKKNLTNYLIPLLINLYLFTTTSVLAQDISYPGIPKPTNKDGKTVIPGPEVLPSDNVAKAKEVHTYFIETFIPYFAKGFSGLVGALCILFLVIGGIQYLTAYGNDEQLQSAKRTIIWSCVGLLIALLAYAIVSIITSLPFPPTQG